MFFLERKNQRTFSTVPTLRRIPPRPGAAPAAKVFCFFFSKKKALLAFKQNTHPTA
jgi:hypothetical protein